MGNTTIKGSQIRSLDELSFTGRTDLPPSPDLQGNGKFYVDKKFAKAIAAFQGWDDHYRFQPHFSDGHVSVAQFSNSATWTWFGAANVLSSGNGAATRSASIYGQQHRISYTTAATADSVAHMRNNGAYFFRGNAAGLGGFLWRQKVGIKLATTTMRSFVGLRANGSAIAAGSITSLTNVIGFSFDRGLNETTWQLTSNDNAGSIVKTDLGSNFPTNTTETDWFVFTLFCFPNDGGVYYHVRNETTGNETDGFISDDTTNLPDGDVFLGWQNWLSNGSVASSVAMDFGTLYIETPY